MSKRSYKDKCTIQWHEEWLQRRDYQGEKLEVWAERHTATEAKCKYCKVTFHYDALGFSAFQSHAKSKTHKNNSDGRNGRMVGQRRIQARTAADTEPGEGEDIDLNANMEDAIPDDEVVVGEDQQDDEVDSGEELAGTRLELGIIRGTNRDRGGGLNRRRTVRLPQQAAQSSMAMNDRVHYAETRLTLLAVERDYSYLSLSNWQQVLSSCDPDSAVFKQIVLNKDKISNIVRYGLYPNIRDSQIRRIRSGGPDGGFFSLGTDECVIRHLGLKKHMDINVRHWDETAGRVEDVFLDLHAVGHAPADVQVRDLLQTLREAGLPLTKVLSLSRDNPTVMRAVARLLKQELTDHGSPGVIDLVCFLHPTHTAFEKLEESLAEEDADEDSGDDEEEEEKRGNVAISSLLSDIYSFMNSTARREDMTEVAQEFAGDKEFNEKLDQFFKRHVVTRWLEMAPCLTRLLGRWQTTVRYFTVYLPNSSSPTDKKALKTERYKNIFHSLKPSQELKTKAKVKFLRYVSKLTLEFLTTFQSTKPMVHLLYTKSVEMFEDLARLIMKPRKFRDMEDKSNYQEIDFHDKNNLLQVPEMTSLASVIQEETDKMSTRDTFKLLYSMRYALQNMLAYLQTHLPLSDPFYKCLGFLSPAVRTEWTGTQPSLVKSALFVAKKMNRFDDEELADLQRQVEIYQSLRQLPDFDDKTDRLDLWWVKVWEIFEKERGERPRALIKLVKMCCVLAHSQAWVERGFSISKMFATDRESLSLLSMKALKCIFSEIKRQGGAEKVVITPTMLNQVKMAGRNAREALEIEQKKKEAEAARDTAEVEASRKRKAEEEIKKDWEIKKKDLESELKSVQKYIDKRTKFIAEEMSKQAKCSDPHKIKDLATSIRLATADKNKQLLLERELQEKLKLLAGKKPRGKGSV